MLRKLKVDLVEVISGEDSTIYDIDVETYDGNCLGIVAACAQVFP